MSDTPSKINRAGVKALALHVAKTRRAGYFTRVGESFLDSVEVQIDGAIRSLAQVRNGTDVRDLPPSRLTTGAAHDILVQRLEEAAVRIVVGKVMSHPSIGCTLKD